jgi:hypothetical protein
MRRTLLSLGIAASVVATAVTTVVLATVVARAGGQHPQRDDVYLGIPAAEATKLTGEKSRLWAEARQRHIDALNSPIPTSSNPNHTRKPTPIPSRVKAGFSPRVNSFGGFVFLNSWTGPVNGGVVEIYAGYKAGEPEKGALLFRDMDEFGNPRENDHSVKLPQSGALRIVSLGRATSIGAVAPDGSVYSISPEQKTAERTSPAQQSLAEGCCSLMVDLSREEGVQPDGGGPVGSTVTATLILGGNPGEVTAFNFKLTYDDTHLTPAAGAGGANGNPDFLESTFGSGWTCTLPSNSGTPDMDPQTGPGHGVAFLSCFTTGPATNITTAPIATMTFTASAVGTTDLELQDVQFGNPAGEEIGSCLPLITYEMACGSGFINVN